VAPVHTGQSVNIRVTFATVSPAHLLVKERVETDINGYSLASSRESGENG